MLSTPDVLLEHPGRPGPRQPEVTGPEERLLQASSLTAEDMTLALLILPTISLGLLLP